MYTPKRKFKIWRGAKRAPKPVVVVAAAQPKAAAKKTTKRKRVRRIGVKSAKTPGGSISPSALHKHLDASAHTALLPVHDTFEPCTTLNNAVRNIHVKTNNTVKQYVGFVWTPSGARVLRKGVHAVPDTITPTNPPALTEEKYFEFNVIDALNETPPPLMLRASRMSVTIRNLGQANQVQGIVRVVASVAPFDLKSDNPPVGWGIDPNAETSLGNLFDHHPKVQTFTGEKLRTAYRINAHHTAMTQSQKFYKHQAWTDSHDYGVQNRHWYGIYDTMKGEQPLQQIWFQFPTTETGADNYYEMVLHCQDAAIYPLDSLGGRMHRRPPAAHPGAPIGANADAQLHPAGAGAGAGV